MAEAKKISLSIPKEQGDASFDLRFEAGNGDVFRKAGIAIHRKGISKTGTERYFNVDYEDLDIHDEIGRGCSSVVCRADHAPSGTPLALKIINMYDKGKRDQLVREIKALYDADCPSLIKFYGAFYRESTITIALEYMDGGSLESMLPQVRRVPERPLAAMAFQILYGLATLHSAQRVHRDIKPSNLLVNSEGQVKITDFGISAELTRSIKMCRTFVGTFKYMSPERVKSQSYGYQSDLWSLGLVLMECATGRYPLQEEDSVIGMVQIIAEADVPRLPRDKFSELMCHMVELLLSKDPVNRLNATVLMGHPWFSKHQQINDVEDCTAIVKEWITSGEWRSNP